MNSDLVITGLEILLILIREPDCRKQMIENKILNLLLMLFDYYNWDILIMEYSITLLNTLLNNEWFILQWTTYHGLDMISKAIELNLHHYSFVECCIECANKCITKVDIPEEYIPPQLISNVLTSLKSNENDDDFTVMCICLFEILTTLQYTKIVLIDGLVDVVIKRMKSCINDCMLLEHGLTLLSLLCFDPNAIPIMRSSNIETLLLTIISRHPARVRLVELVLQIFDNFVTLNTDMRESMKEQRYKDFLFMFKNYDSDLIHTLLTSILTILEFI